MRKFDLVIFDCDGVLVESERSVVKLEAQIFRERGWSLTEDDIIREFVGLSDVSMRARLSEIVGMDLADDWDAEYSDRYRQTIAENVEPVTGISTAIDIIEQSGLLTCVASSGSHEKMALTLGTAGLLERFEGRIYSATDPKVARGKPAPDLFLHAAEQMGVPPHKCAVVEDSPFGLVAALDAGMSAFGFAGSVVPTHRIAFEGVTVFESMADLPQLLLVSAR